MQTLTLGQYLPLALRTEKMLPSSQRKTHHLMGLVTELGELVDIFKKSAVYGKPFDKVNLVEEAGDTLWYCAGLANTFGVTEHDFSLVVVNKPTHYAPDDMFKVADEFLRQVCQVMYRLVLTCNTGSEVSCDRTKLSLAHALSTLMVDVHSILVLYTGMGVPEAMSVNIAKLSARYGEKYTDDAAMVRNLQQEYALLKEGPQ